MRCFPHSHSAIAHLPRDDTDDSCTTNTLGIVPIAVLVPLLLLVVVPSAVAVDEVRPDIGIAVVVPDSRSPRVARAAAYSKPIVVLAELVVEAVPAAAKPVAVVVTALLLAKHEALDLVPAMVLVPHNLLDVA